VDRFEDRAVEAVTELGGVLDPQQDATCVSNRLEQHTFI
jgi:hypothetical protein